jgi:hypothetical protein
MKLSIYKSLLNGNNNLSTMFVASKGKCGYADYVEYQVIYKFGRWYCYKTDGYKMENVGIYLGVKSLKSVLNLIWGK